MLAQLLCACKGLGQFSKVLFVEHVCMLIENARKHLFTLDLRIYNCHQPLSLSQCLIKLKTSRDPVGVAIWKPP